MKPRIATVDAFTTQAFCGNPCAVVTGADGLGLRHALKGGPILRIEQGHLVGRPGRGELEVAGGADGITGIGLSGSAVKTTEGEILL